MDDLRANLVIHRDDVKATVRALDAVLGVLVVVADAAVSEQLALVVLVGEVLGTEHVEVLRTEARIK